MALSFTGPRPACSIIVHNIPNTVVPGDLAQALSSYGALEYCGRCSVVFKEDAYSVKATFYDPVRAREASRAIRQGKLPWPGLRVSPASTQRAANEGTMAMNKCSTFVNEAMGALNWSTSIEHVRSQPLATAPRSDTGAPTAGDLGLFVLGRVKLRLPPDIFGTAANLQESARQRRGLGDPDAFGPEPAEAGEEEEADEDGLLSVGGRGTARPFEGDAAPAARVIERPVWGMTTFPIVFRGIPLVERSGEVPIREIQVRQRRPNFGPVLPDPVTRPTGAAQRGGAASKGGGTSGRPAAGAPSASATAAPKARSAPAAASTAAQPRKHPHSCVRVKVAVILRNPDGSTTASNGYGGCDCAPPTALTRLEAVHEALARISATEITSSREAAAAVAAAQGSGGVHRGLQAAEDGLDGAREADSDAPGVGVKRPRSAYSAVVRLLEHQTGGLSARREAAMDSGVVLPAMPWNPIVASASRAQAAQAFHDLTFSAEQGANGSHLKFAISDAHRDALGALVLLPGSEPAGPGPVPGPLM